MTIELLSQELQDLKGLHEEKVAELELEKDAHLRLQAEFENFRRRSLKEKQESFKFGHQNLVKDLLSTVDNLERALEHGAQNAGEEAKGILDGVELVHREILGALAKHAVTEIEAEGKPFDPAVHEAMGQIPERGGGSEHRAAGAPEGLRDPRPDVASVAGDRLPRTDGRRGRGEQRVRRSDEGDRAREALRHPGHGPGRRGERWRWAR